MAKGPISAVVGLGFSALSRRPIGAPRILAVQALREAILDSGLGPAEIDGLMVTQSALAAEESIPLKIQNDLGLRDLRFLNMLEAKGSSVVQMLQVASMAVAQGMAQAIACVFADAPLTGTGNAGSAFASASPLTGIAGWDAQYGLFGATGTYAMAARRYMVSQGVTARHLGSYAIACRQWAALNPMAFLKDPLTMEQYLASRMVVDPLRVLDCAYPVNGAVAVIVTAPDRGDCLKPPVFIHGMGQGHSGMPGLVGLDPEVTTGGALAGRVALGMAGSEAAGITQAQIYDAFSFSALIALEDYGLCKPGMAGDFVAAGETAPGGRLPVNTGGGHLSGYYLQGMTPVAEAIMQGRGEAEARQCSNDLILVTNSGGRLENHAALIMSPMRSLA